MLTREIVLLVRATNAIKNAEPRLTLDEAKARASSELGLPVPEANEFDRIRRGMRKVGRPPANYFRRSEDFAILVMYFAGIGHKQSTRAAIDYWAYPRVSRMPPPTARQIEEGLRKVKVWDFDDLASAAELVRRRYVLEPLPVSKKRTRY